MNLINPLRKVLVKSMLGDEQKYLYLKQVILMLEIQEGKTRGYVVY